MLRTFFTGSSCSDILAFPSLSSLLSSLRSSPTSFISPNRTLSFVGIVLIVIWRSLSTVVEFGAKIVSSINSDTLEEESYELNFCWSTYHIFLFTNLNYYAIKDVGTF